MTAYDSALADLRARARSKYDLVRAPATLDAVERLRAAMQARLDMELPDAYEQFLLACNGFRVDGGRVLGVDGSVMSVATPDAPASVLDGCLAYNLDRAEAGREAGFTEPFLFLAWYDEASWGVKADGSCWERDPESWEDIERYRDVQHMLLSVTKRIGGDI